MIDRQSHTPLYIQFYDLLRKELRHYPVGANLPPERALCEEYSIDRVTVRKALSMLKDEGLIERRQGQGTRVVRHPSGQEGPVLFILYQGANLVDRLGEPFYARSIDALERYLQKKGKRLIYGKVRRDEDLKSVLTQLDARGVIIAGTPDAQMQAQCESLDVPLVGYNTRIGDLPSVMADNEDGARLSAQHLLSLSHRQIGFINVPGHLNSEKRLSRFHLEMKRAGLAEDALSVAQGDWSEESGYRAALELLRRSPRVTALFGGNDSMAIGAMRAAQELGLSIPDDLSIVGFDGIAQSALTQPGLTTMQIDVKVMAEAACMLLAHRMDGGATRGIHAVVTAEFIHRNSTARAKDS